MNQKLLDFVSKYGGSVVDNSLPNFDFLEEGDEWLMIPNPYGSADLFARCSCDGFLLIFDDWHMSYENSDEGVDQLIRQAQDFMDDRSYIWKAKVGNKQFLSVVNDDPGMFYQMAKTSLNALLEQILNIPGSSMQPGDQIESILVVWDPAMMEPEVTPYLN